MGQSSRRGADGIQFGCDGRCDRIGWSATDRHPKGRSRVQPAWCPKRAVPNTSGLASICSAGRSWDSEPARRRLREVETENPPTWWCRGAVNAPGHTNR